VSLHVLPDGSIDPYKPHEIVFKDAGKIRPVCPFFELHAKVNGEEKLHLVTPGLLKEAGILSLAQLSFQVHAANRKAARFTGDDSCVFGARVRVLGNNHARHPLLACSSGANGLVSKDHPISLGTFQVIRPRYCEERYGVRLDGIRVRFTPAKGNVYGPPGIGAGQTGEDRAPHRIVPPENRILNPNSSWMTYTANAPRLAQPMPDDQYDGAEDLRGGNVSWGVVDDTCDAIITAMLATPDAVFKAKARVLVGPPDFAPDRRPFFSLAEELADRDWNSVPDANGLGLHDAVVDLFRRALETASIVNVDRQRANAIQTNDPPPPNTFPFADANTLTPADKLTAKGPELLSNFGRDILKDPGYAPGDPEPLPRSELAQLQHEQMADPEYLVWFFRERPERLREIVRPPFAKFRDLKKVFAGPASPYDKRDPRDGACQIFDMRMPPYMKDSDYKALSLTRRQYDQLLEYVNAVKKQGGKLQPQSPTQQSVDTFKQRQSQKAKK
jgi:hypothetical protein